MKWPHGSHQRENSWNLSYTDRWKMHFSWIFLGILEFHGDFWRNVAYKDTYIQLCFMRVCKHLNQRLRRIGEIENLSRVFKKTNKKKNIKRLSFITQFKIEFLLPFTSCRKVLGKMPDLFKANKENKRSIMEICSKLTTPDLRQWRRSNVSLVHFEQK